MSEAEKTPENPATPAEPAQPWTKPPGYDPVDLDALGIPPEKQGPIRERFNHLYVQVKTGGEERRELRKHLDQLTEAIDKRIAPLEQAKTEDSKGRTMAAIKNARDEGRVEDEVNLIAEMNKIEPEKPVEKKPETKKWDEDPRVTGWATEVQNGELKRPWIIQGHPSHARAMGELFTIKNDWESQGIPLNEQTVPLLLNELDKRMGPNVKPTQAAVLSTSQVRPQARPGEIELTHEQKDAANKLYSHIKDPAKRIEAYAKAYGFLKTQGMAR